MKLDQAGKAFIQENEASGKCRLKAYLDTGGVPTIGWGSTTMFGKPVKMGMTCTQEEADEQFEIDVADSESDVLRLVTVPLTQNQFNALVDFVYNIGEVQFAKSTLRRKLNAKDYAGAADQFLRWEYDNGKKVAGLKDRRVRTKALFLK